MKKHTSSSRYWQERNSMTQNKGSKFNMLFEVVMSGIPVYQDIKNDPTLFFRKPDLKLICEDVCRDHYIISEATGDAILLEECLFWSERQLIAEGILDKVFSAVKGIYEKIKDGIAKIITESSDAIKSFCEKIMNSKIVVAIRNKLGLDEKLDKEKFKKYIKIENADGEEVNDVSEAIYANNDRHNVITEATKLSKKEEAITDPAEVQKYIDKYKAHLDGSKVLKNKSGKPLNKDYAKQRLRLFKKKLNALNGGNNNGEKTAGSVDNSTAANASADANNNANANSGNAGQQDAGNGKPKKTAGKIVIKEGIGSVASRVGEQVTSNEAVSSASTTAAVAEGGDAAKQELKGAQQQGEQKPNLASSTSLEARLNLEYKA